MPTEADHIALANKNQEALAYLIGDAERYPEWVTTVAFYKAVQLVEALFARRHGRSCHGHAKRLELLKQLGFKMIHRHYRALWGASSVARYLYDTVNNGSYSSFEDYCSADRVVGRFVERRLCGLEDELIGELSPDQAKALQKTPRS